ncbi:MAG TPA: DUF5320 domain-containing protein [Candidatus Cloacimonas sp.]|nr:DUF5320 domain-containing protein [Candidatus Cloacimonas sp.]
MPSQDGTGPYGTGRPGRGFGLCGRFGREILRKGRCMGRGFRFRGGMGMRGPNMWIDESGSCRRDIYSYSRQELENQKQDLERQLTWVNDQLQNSKDE